MDFYSASGIPILWCCFFQTIAIGWIFGAQKFGNCVEQMTGYKPNAYWIWTWGFIAPVIMAVSRFITKTRSPIRKVFHFQVIFLSYLISWSPVKYGNIEYPTYAHVLGLCMSAASMLWIPGYAIYYILNQRGSLKDRLIKGVTPDIKSARVKAPPKTVVKDLQMSESSARLLKNSSFLTQNNSFNFPAENP